MMQTTPTSPLSPSKESVIKKNAEEEEPIQDNPIDIPRDMPMVEETNPINNEADKEVSDQYQENEGHSMDDDEDPHAGNVEVNLPPSPLLEEKEAEGDNQQEDVEVSEDDNDNNDGEEKEEENPSEPEDESLKSASPPKTVPSTSTSLSQKELSELKSKNPLEAFKLLLSGRSSIEEKLSTSTASGGGNSENSQEDLVKELQIMLFEVDLFKAIEEDHMITFKFKALLNKLNTPASSKSLIGFIVELEPLLETITGEIKKKKEIAANKEREDKLQKEEWVAVEASKAKISELQAQADQDSKEIAECDAAIAKYQEKIKALQQKKASIQKKESAINEEAASAIEHFENATQHEEQVRKLVESEDLIATRLEHSWNVLLKMKMNIVQK